jgi:predicted DNA binding CopG/RHH family protein
LRLPQHLLDEIKMLAGKQDVPYQSLIVTLHALMAIGSAISDVSM